MTQFPESTEPFTLEDEETRMPVQQEPIISPTITPVHGVSPDPHSVSTDEARLYYAGLHSSPLLLYRTGKEPFPPSGSEAYNLLKELRPVFNHPIRDIWNTLSSKLIPLLDVHAVCFTSVDLVRFKTFKTEAEDEKGVSGPVTIWIGVIIENTTATAAHNAATDIIALLEEHNIIDVQVEFRNSSINVQALSFQSRLLVR
ncbi:hypothetical protein DL96DRAFT_1778973 [Flagelloscypha sp. PMI_526]|nr:hypothetical protein DL96DRAFT_1778973 [Flagelloscypha sp. PMI_526]